MKNTDIAYNNNQKIASLQALRALAFFGVFFSHVYKPTMWSTLSVSVFYVMSGFLMFIRYGDHEMSCSLKDSFRFSVSKIKKMYPLHIITMVLALIMNIVLDIHNHVMNLSFAMDLLIRSVLDISLLTAWASDYGSINGVAWYLSVMLFLYFCFPFFKNKVKNAGCKSLLFASLIILALQMILCKTWLLLFGFDIQSDLVRYTWLSYYFPVFRLGDFAIGCFLARCMTFDNREGLIKNEDDNKPCISALISVLELFLLALTILVIIYPFDRNLFIWVNPYFNLTTMYIPLAAGWIYFFVIKKGLITTLLDNKISERLGDYSGYMFLIHAVVTFYTDRLLNLLDLEPAGFLKLIIIAIEFIITFAASFLYKKYESALFKKSSAQK